MVSVAHARYERFDQQRRATEALQADAADLQEIERLEQRVVRRAKTMVAAKAAPKSAGRKKSS